MADQQRWFKLWTTAPADDALLTLSPAHRWAWAVLGCHTKAHGTRGRVRISASNAPLAALMGVTVEDLRAVISTFPNVSVSDVVEEGTTVNGTFVVTWANWSKYQEDTTRAARVRTWRNKRRGDERRGDERRKTPLTGSRDGAQTDGVAVTEPPATNGHGPAPPPVVVFRIPESVAAALDRAPVLGKVPALRRPEWWQAEVRANVGADLASAVLDAEAWMRSNPARAPKSDFPRFLHSWFKRAERVEAL